MGAQATSNSTSIGYRTWTLHRVSVVSLCHSQCAFGASSIPLDRGIGAKAPRKADKDLGTGLKFFKRTVLFLKILILQLKWSYPPDRQQSGNGSAKIFLAVSCGGFLPSYVKFRHRRVLLHAKLFLTGPEGEQGK